MNSQPIFILGAHKSGTSLLRSLFDGNQGIFVVPMESHPFLLLNFWVRYSIKKRPIGSMDADSFISNAVDWISKSNRNVDVFSDSILENIFNEAVFKEFITNELKNLKKDNSKFIEAYFNAIYTSLSNGVEMKESTRVVEKSVENFEFVNVLKHLFPQAFFIHIIRNPYSNLVSLRKYKSRSDKFPHLPRLVKTIEDSFYYAFINSQSIEKYKILRYEDLVSNPEHEMRDICKFTDLEFSESFLRPTSRGDKWGGNSIYQRVHAGISSSSLNKWKKEVTKLEIEFINKSIEPNMSYFGYDRMHKSEGKSMSFSTIALNLKTIVKSKLLLNIG